MELSQLGLHLSDPNSVTLAIASPVALAFLFLQRGLLKRLLFVFVVKAVRKRAKQFPTSPSND